MIAAACLLFFSGAIFGSLITAWGARIVLNAERDEAQAELKRAMEHAAQPEGGR